MNALPPHDSQRRVALLTACAMAAALAGCATPAPPPRPGARLPAPDPRANPGAPPQEPRPGALTSPVPSSPAIVSNAPPPAPAPAPAPTGRAPTLADELARLSNELAGTPVVVELLPAGPLRVEVPARFCFDAGKAVVKPPLAAVLDRMATGLKRQLATQLRISAPLDTNGGAQLANERAASVRDYFVARGVAPGRISSTGRSERPGLEVVVADPNT